MESICPSRGLYALGMPSTPIPASASTLKLCVGLQLLNGISARYERNDERTSVYRGGQWLLIFLVCSDDYSSPDNYFGTS
ncbi:hypothetical protein KSP40_PGU000274 [Platanthera guangdongensis]|uniref:NADH-plastoquinone oxidoreductase subunit K n=1 Tax=Platanthera guangdongensis TaxID=2320717 RepID=A0ABR2MBU5_9ASPA